MATMKRAFDILFSCLGIVLSIPVMGVAALLIWLIDGRPILFRQVRPGRLGQPFTVLKFRTMTETAGIDGGSVSDVDRITSLGHILRRTSVDELPQLVNVSRGEMSFVGPRPLLMEYLPYYTDRESRRHDVRPGMTGLAQVNGRNMLPWDERLELDVQYVESFSMLLDLRILGLTVRNVLRQSGVVAPGTAGQKLSDLRRAGGCATNGRNPV